MATYAFETITAEQASNIRPGDTVTFAGGAARDVRVFYFNYEPGSLLTVVPFIEITFGGRTVRFDTNVTQANLVMADGSKLEIGDTSNERVTGGAGHDGLFGGPGDDSLVGMGGDDFIHGNTGHDVLTGGEGADTIHGGQGDDVIYTSRDVQGVAGEAGDFAHGNLGDDEIVGGAGRDTLLGGQGNDFIGGRDGHDYISGDLGNDELHGGEGDDTLVGGAGDDTLSGAFGADNLSGGDGNDSLVTQGPAGTRLDGGAGNDTIVAAGAGKDLIWGGAGRDRFEFVVRSDPAQGQDDVIHDWESSDTLHFAEVSIFGPASILPRDYSEFVAGTYAEALRIANEHIMYTGARYVSAQVGNDVIVFAEGNGDSSDGADIAVVLVGRSLADIDLSNFG